MGTYFSRYKTVVHPLDDILWNPGTVIVTGDQGTGKTATVFRIVDEMHRMFPLRYINGRYYRIKAQRRTRRIEKRKIAAALGLSL